MNKKKIIILNKFLLIKICSKYMFNKLNIIYYFFSCDSHWYFFFSGDSYASIVVFYALLELSIYGSWVGSVLWVWLGLKPDLILYSFYFFQPLPN